MKKFALIFLPLLFIPTLVSAQVLSHWYDYLNIPADFATFPNLLYFILIPFLGTFTIIWGILTNLRIFRVKRVNIILSFLFALALLYSTLLTSLTFYLFHVGGIFGIVIFFGLFFLGTLIFSGGLIYGWGGHYGAYSRAIAEQKKLREEFKSRLAANRNEYYDAQHGRGKYTGVGASAAHSAMLRLDMEAVELRKFIAACDAKIVGFKSHRRYAKNVYKRMQKT